MAYSLFKDILDTLDYGEAFHAGQNPDLIHISGNVYAIAFSEVPGTPDGRIDTFSIDADGNFSAVIDTLEFDVARAERPRIIHVSGDTYAIVYAGPDLDGWLVTLTINAAGNIGGAVIDSLEFDGGNGTSPQILHLDGEFFVIIYTGPGSDGWLATVEIDAAGNITNPITDSWNFDAGWGLNPHIIHVAGTIYAFTYAKLGGAGTLTTIDIANNGVIGAVVDTYQFAADCTPNKPLHIAGDIYAIAWCNWEGAQVVTIEIDAAGNIAAAATDTLMVDNQAEDNWTVDFVHFGDDVYILAYQGDRNLNDRGWVASVRISAAGALGLLDRFEYETLMGIEMLSLIAVSSTIIAVATFIPWDGVIKTIGFFQDPAVQTNVATEIK